MERQRYCRDGARQSDEHEWKLRQKSMQTEKKIEQIMPFGAFSFGIAMSQHLLRSYTFP